MSNHSLPFIEWDERAQLFRVNGEAERYLSQFEGKIGAAWLHTGDRSPTRRGAIVPCTAAAIACAWQPAVVVAARTRARLTAARQAHPCLASPPASIRQPSRSSRGATAAASRS